MKITIDTKEDSSKEIKRVINLLNMLVDTTPITETTSDLINNETKNDYMELPNVENFMDNNEDPKEKKEEEKPKESSSIITY